MNKGFIANGLIGLKYDRAQVVAGSAGYKIRAYIINGISIFDKKIYTRGLNVILVEVDENDFIIAAEKA